MTARGNGLADEQGDPVTARRKGGYRGINRGRCCLTAMPITAHRKHMSATRSRNLLAATSGQARSKQGNPLELAVPALLTLAVAVWNPRAVVLAG